jgi:hypothetical protein
MQKIHIPQEINSTLNGQRKVMYAPNNNGKFQRFNYGSDVEEYATKLAIKEYENLMNISKENETTSPIEFYMYKNRMDIPTLASSIGIMKFRVKRHLKIKIFHKLDDTLLKKYANIFQITLAELKGLKV